MPFTLPNLPFAYDALEPVIDAETMKIHHDRHHRGYVDKLNQAITASVWETRSIVEILRRLHEVHEDVRTAVRNNGGGHFNHALFWRCLAPSKQAPHEPEGDLAKAIDEAFGSLDAMKKAFGEQARSRFGSGWAWLCLHPDGRLHVTSTANQDTTLMPIDCGGLGSDHVPILGLDVWEHAYYLKHQNDRGAYIDGWWDVVNWSAVGEHFESARESSAVATS